MATALLAAACQKFKRDGLAMAEDYPTVEFPELPYKLALSAHNYHGPLTLFLNQGFQIHRSLGSGAVVRNSLS